MSSSIDLPPLKPEHADATNWRSPPYNRWAFNNVAKILPTAPIAADPAGVLTLSSKAVSLAAFKLAEPDGSALDLDGFLKATSTDAIVVLKDGRLVFEAYDGDAAPETPHILMSSTKAMVGLIAGSLQQSGELNLDAAVSSYVPEISKTAYDDATIRQLLDMRTGTIMDEAQTGQYDAAVHRSFADGMHQVVGLHGVLKGLTVRSKPNGGAFSYISPNTDLAGWAMERASGRSFAQLVSERLWKPMGAEFDASVILDAEGSPWCAGGMCATARDFARVGALVINQGRRDGVEVLPQACVHDLYWGGDLGAWATGAWGEAFSGVSRTMAYRAGWYAVRSEPQHLFAMGVHGQNLFVDHLNQVVIAKLSSQPQRIDFQAISRTHRAAAEIIRCLTAP